MSKFDFDAEFENFDAFAQGEAIQEVTNDEKPMKPDGPFFKFLIDELVADSYAAAIGDRVDALKPQEREYLVRYTMSHLMDSLSDSLEKRETTKCLGLTVVLRILESVVK